MKQYHDYLKYILENGTKKEDRTGTGTISVFGYQMRFDLSKGFPLVTTKKLHFKSIAIELLWFLSGDTNTKFLNDNGVTIWDEWALKEDHAFSDGWKTSKGDLGPIYGKQWTSWKTPYGVSINQITKLIQDIRNNPDSRRLIVSAWNPSNLPDEEFSPQENVQMGNMALAPCHAFFQFYVKALDVFDRVNVFCRLHGDKKWDYYFSSGQIGYWNDYKDDEYKENWIKTASEILDSNNIPKASLSCMLTQRSTDSFLGVPYNIASYALLTEMIAQQCDLVPGELIWSGGDCHIYTNHLEQVNLQLQREPYELPRLNFKRKPESIFDYKYEDFEILDYQAHSHIKGAVAV